MIKIDLHTNATLRFRRWSRKHYAAFVSLNKCVTIGKLKNSIADFSLSKQQLSLISVFTNKRNKDAEEVLNPSDERVLDTILSLLLPCSVLAKPDERGINSYKSIKNKMRINHSELSCSERFILFVYKK